MVLSLVLPKASQYRHAPAVKWLISRLYGGYPTEFYASQTSQIDHQLRTRSKSFRSSDLLEYASFDRRPSLRLPCS